MRREGGTPKWPRRPETEQVGRDKRVDDRRWESASLVELRAVLRHERRQSANGLKDALSPIHVSAVHGPAPYAEVEALIGEPALLSF
jgi:hypothetical protein